MCFGVAPFAYCSVHAAPIFRSFEPSPWHVAAWKWLLEKHPIARQTFFAISFSSKRACNWQFSTFLSRFSRFLSLRSKLSSLNRRNQSLHVVSDKALSPPVGLHKHSIRFGSQFLQIEIEKQSFPHMLFFSKKLDMITKEKMYVVVWNCSWYALG